MGTLVFQLLNFFFILSTTYLKLVFSAIYKQINVKIPAKIIINMNFVSLPTTSLTYLAVCLDKKIMVLRQLIHWPYSVKNSFKQLSISLTWSEFALKRRSKHQQNIRWETLRSFSKNLSLPLPHNHLTKDGMTQLINT